ncbi:type II toxin-antitoxin system HigB family toxin [Humisphaera borealis]|uniref:Type II toxin-antitoxin system HigB family toxin n=1 Tax=Humisphaera borealis TaxID=2807512 RepID=A0A7M2X3V1_9BACT|nr:type II toxin-antitoxin system HigB family toxin [Humisphaera borealis]
MRVISRRRLREFWDRHPPAEQSLKNWYALTRKAQWQSIADVRRTFPHADAVTLDCRKVVTIFNVAGNHYRLVVDILYQKKVVYVKVVLTHADYDSEPWKARICRE